MTDLAWGAPQAAEVRVDLDPQLLLAEVKALRRGRGVVERRVRSRTGPQVRALCGITENDSDASCREKLIARLEALAQALPPDQRLAVLAALAVHPDAQQRFLHERVTWVAERLKRSDRAARRRIDDGFGLLVEHITRGGPRPQPAPGTGPPGQQWYVRSFSALMRFDTPKPELWEQRTIEFTRDGVTEIVAELSHPPRTGGRATLEVEVLYGVRQLRREHVSPSHLRVVLGLPRAYDVGETLDYGMLFRTPDRRFMKPHYAFVPLRPCAEFTLRLRFDPAALPGRMWRLGGVPPRVIDDRTPTGDLLQADKIGELTLTFTDLTQGLAYGAQWDGPRAAARS
jgi:hypothetical protein